MISLIKYYTFRQVYAKGQKLTSDCNSITFFNTGTTIMYIDNVAFAPSQSLVFAGNVGEYTEQTFDLSFSGIGSNQCTVYRKTYVND